jgi:hypothetical protein
VIPFVLNIKNVVFKCVSNAIKTGPDAGDVASTNVEDLEEEAIGVEESDEESQVEDERNIDNIRPRFQS